MNADCIFDSFLNRPFRFGECNYDRFPEVFHLSLKKDIEKVFFRVEPVMQHGVSHTCFLRYFRRSGAFKALIQEYLLGCNKNVFPFAVFMLSHRM